MGNFWNQNSWFNRGANPTNQRREEVTSNYIDETRPAPMAIIYRSEIDYISQCILDYQNIETGGQLFGFVTEYGVPVVCYAIGPGRNANHQSTFFNQDTQYLQSVYNELNRRYQLQYIGEWHSHHQLGLARPSGHDAQTIIRGIQRQHLRHFLLCIGNCSRGRSTLNAFTFHLEAPQDYQQVPWKICEMTSPYRPIVDRDLKHMLEHPLSRPNHGELYVTGRNTTAQMTVPSYQEDYWLNNKANNLVLKNMIDYLSVYSGYKEMVKPMIDQKKQVHLQIERNDHSEAISFGSQFPYSPPKIIMSIELDMDRQPAWNYVEDGDDILACFEKYYDDYVDIWREAYWKKMLEQSSTQEATAETESETSQPTETTVAPAEDSTETTVTPAETPTDTGTAEETPSEETTTECATEGNTPQNSENQEQHETDNQPTNQPIES